MASIHKKLKIALVFGDGEGGQVLKVTAVDGEHLDMPLTAELAIKLAYDLLGGARQLIEPAPSHEELKKAFGVKA